jgi:pyruvate carboxylase subunit B
MRYHVTVADRTIVVDISNEGVTVSGQRVDAKIETIPDSPVRSLLLDDASHRLVARAAGRGRWELSIRGQQLSVDVMDERALSLSELTGGAALPSGPKPVRAPMPGMVVRVEVAEGDQVSPGQALLIVEAMKMENELRAETAGRIRRVHVAAGEAVAKDQILVDLAAAEDD